MTAPHLGPGQVVAGKYTIHSLLAFSGATATYHATDPQGGQVALKLLDPAIGQRADVMGALDRITAETSALAQVSVHPVLDSGYDHATSAPFRVTEFLTIPSLARLLENGPLSGEVVRAIVQGLAVPLDAAHARGLFHLALKPSNVFVGPAPHYPVLVADFGARVIRDAVPTRETYALSAPWWAPEQMQQAAPLGPHTDVYAVALLAFYALTGRSYWRSCQTSPPEIEAWQHEVLAPHIPVSVRAAELGRPINEALDGVFARALSADPTARPQRVAEFAQGLAQPTVVIADQPPPTHPVPQQHGGYPAAPAVAASAPQAAPPDAYALAAASGAQAAAQPVSVPPAAAQPVSVPPAAPHPATPGLPAFPEPAPRRKRSGALPIVIGVVGAVLLGGGAVAYLFLRSTDSDGQARATAEASSDTSTAGGTAATAGSGVARTDDAGPADGAAAAGAGETVEVKFVCVPACGQIKVDGDEVKDLDKPLQLLPGKHTVEVSKSGYIPRKETVMVELGSPLEKKFVLVRVRPAGEKKPCGKFLKRCD